MQSLARKGTATRRAGAQTATKLIATAHDLLETQPLARFTMRNIAESAGVSLANLQYYFPRREDLVHAMSVDLDQRYRKAQAAVLADMDTGSPLERFQAVLRYQLEDISLKSTRQFFIQYWALLGSMDGFKGSYLKDLYAYDIAQITEHLAELRPELSEQRLIEISTLIAAMIEGLMLMIEGTEKKAPLNTKLIDAAFDSALALAMSE
ncbi:MAG: TetR/AcrR family transcriptional regulator [Pseudomonadales bacterium]